MCIIYISTVVLDSLTRPLPSEFCTHYIYSRFVYETTVATLGTTIHELELIFINNYVKYVYCHAYFILFIFNISYPKYILLQYGVS